ncbi:DUF6804 family protein [Clavibacter michiganensis]|uniref:DUF6804 family protein n=1 Tax=Clavibacter michiganensis TaxID=28447 RepID=UPI001C6528A2|nr:DUF6804 family protein [Clavibacter michiganensis]MBW8027792.1 hypothetical protein [Clavibacter michiganensis subsp. michiganensis]
MTRTPAAPAFTRPSLAPGLLGAIVLLAGFAVIDGDLFTVVRFAVAILALIMIVFSVRARSWWSAALLAAVAVMWNPVAVIPVEAVTWQSLQYVAAIVFIAAGILVNVPVEDAPTPGRPRTRAPR